MAEKLTATDYAGWTTARHVADKFYALKGFVASVNSLGDKLRVGLVHAAAGHVSVNLNQADKGPVRIPNGHWKEIKALAHDDLWQTGQVTIWVREQMRSEKVRYDYHDVRFEPSSLGDMLATMMPAPVMPLEFAGGSTWVDREYDSGFVGAEQTEDPPPAPTAKHAGGAPFKPFWDDLWAAMGGLVHKGALNPGSKQKDIEEAMCQWASDNNHELSIPAARPRARKLLAALKKAEEDNN